MYEIVKNVINKRDYNLTDMLKKIDTLWIEGHLAEAECSELKELARASAKFENSIGVLEKLKELDMRLSKVENSIKTDDETTKEEFPEYVAGNWYYTGDKVTFEGVNYVCVAPDGTVCVWSPKEYPTFWDKA